MATDFDLTDKVAIVTGGNGGIGYGIARGLAQAGAHIVVAARDPAKKPRRCTEGASQGCRTLWVTGGHGDGHATRVPQARSGAYRALRVQLCLPEGGRLS